MSKSFHLPFPPALFLSLSPSPSPTSQSDPLSHNPPTSMQASKRARKQALSTKKPPTTALSIFGLLRQGLKRRAAFSAASKVIKTRCNNQSRRRRGSASRTGGGGKKRNTLKDAGYRTAWTDMYIYTCIRTFNEDNSILWSFSPLVFFFFFFFFFLFVLQWPRKCYWNTIAVQV